MNQKSRWGIGIVGARGWGGTAHIPALRTLEEYEIKAVTGTRIESAKKAAQSHGIESYYIDTAEMASRPDIDIVVVTVRVPEHKRIIQATLEAGKHVFCEWPLAQNTEEARELAAMASDHNVVHITGLQARANPTIRRLQEMVKDAVVGHVLAVNAVVSLPDFPTKNGTVDLAHTYLLDEANGADQLTIGSAHILDSIAYMVSPFREISAKMDTQFPSVNVLENRNIIRADAPDHVLINGRLTQGALVSLQVVNGGVAGFSLRIIGTEGEILITPQDGLMFQMDRLHVDIMHPSGKSVRLNTPETFSAHENIQPGASYNVAHLYALFAQQLAGNKIDVPDFHHAFHMHKLLDVIRNASKTGTWQSVNLPE